MQFIPDLSPGSTWLALTVLGCGRSPGIPESPGEGSAEVGVQLGERSLEIDPLAVLVSPSAQICTAERNHLRAAERGPKEIGILASHLLCDFGQVTFPSWASAFS